MPTLFPKESVFFSSENLNVQIFWGFEAQKSEQFWLNRNSWQVCLTHSGVQSVCDGMWDGAKVEKVGKCKVGAEHDSSHFSPCQSLTGIRILTKVDVTKIDGGGAGLERPCTPKAYQSISPQGHSQFVTYFYCLLTGSALAEWGTFVELYYLLHAVLLELVRAVTKISSCRVYEISRRGTEQQSCKYM